MIRIAFVLTAMLVAAGPQEPDYRQEALGAVSESLIEQGLEPQDFALEARGLPVVFPDHEQWHIDDYEGPATVSGQVRDATGALIPGCEVALLSGGELVSVTTSDDEGRFHMGGLAISEHTLRVEMPGFKRREVTFSVDANQRRDLGIVLEVGEMTQTISTREPDGGAAGGPGLGLPRAMVLVLATIGDEVRSFNVLLPPGGRFGVIAPMPRGHRPRDQRAMTRAQWEQAVTQAAPFYDVAVRIEHGPERFFPWISDSWALGLLASGMGFSAEEARAYLAFYLDANVLSTWLKFEGLKYPRTSSEGGMTEAEELQLAKKTAAAVRNQLIEHLRDAGADADNSQHTEALTPYLRRYLGEGLVGRRDLMGTEVWVTRMLPSMSVSFEIVGGRFQIVSLVVHD